MSPIHTPKKQIGLLIYLFLSISCQTYQAAETPNNEAKDRISVTKWKNNKVVFAGVACGASLASYFLYKKLNYEELYFSTEKQILLISRDSTSSYSVSQTGIYEALETCGTTNKFIIPTEVCETIISFLILWPPYQIVFITRLPERIIIGLKNLIEAARTHRTLFSRLSSSDKFKESVPILLANLSIFRDRFKDHIEYTNTRTHYQKLLKNGKTWYVTIFFHAIIKNRIYSSFLVLSDGKEKYEIKQPLYETKNGTNVWYWSKPFYSKDSIELVRYAYSFNQQTKQYDPQNSGLPKRFRLNLENKDWEWEGFYYRYSTLRTRPDTIDVVTM